MGIRSHKISNFHDYTASRSGSGEKVLMVNRTPPHVCEGLGRGKAKAASQYEMDEGLGEILKIERAREAQADLALTYVLRRPGQDDVCLDQLATTDPMRIIFVDTILAFKRARSFEVNGRKIGAIAIAVQQVRTGHQKVFFDSYDYEETAKDGSKWAEEALRWAGNQLYVATQARRVRPAAKPAKITPLIMAKKSQVQAVV